MSAAQSLFSTLGRYSFILFPNDKQRLPLLHIHLSEVYVPKVCIYVDTVGNSFDDTLKGHHEARTCSQSSHVSICHANAKLGFSTISHAVATRLGLLVTPCVEVGK